MDTSSCTWLLVPLILLTGADNAEPPRRDLFGDLLPPGVVARMGSGRMRHADLPSHLFFSPDGKAIVSTSTLLENFCAFIWDAEDGKLLKRLEVIKGAQFPVDVAIARAESSLVVAATKQEGKSWSAIVRRLNLSSGKAVTTIKFSLPDSPYTLKLSDDGARVAVLLRDDSVRLFDVAGGHEVLRLPNRDGPITVAWSRDGKRMALFRARTIGIYDTTTGAELGRLPRQEGVYVQSMDFSPDGRSLVSVGSEDNSMESTAILWDLITGTERRRAEALRWFGAGFSPDGRYIALRGWDQNPALLETSTGKLRKFRVPWASLIAFSPDSKRLAICHRSSIALLDVATGGVLPPSADPMADIHQLRFADGGKRLIGTAEKVVAWDGATGKEIQRFPNMVSNLNTPASLSPDESLLAGMSPDGKKIAVWDAASGKELRTLEEKGRLWSPGLWPDNGKLISMGEEGVWLWDARTGQVLKKMTDIGPEDRPRLLSPDRKWLVCVKGFGRAEPIVRFWDLATGREVQRFTGPGTHVPALAYSLDGRLLAAVSRPDDKTERTFFKIWDVKRGKEYRVWEGPQGAMNGFVLALGFSPDGRTLVSGGYGKILQFWEVAAGKERHQIKGHEGGIYSLAFSPVGNLLAAASPEAPVYVWDIWAGLPPAKNLSAEDLARCWKELAGDDAAAAFRAIRLLSTAPEQSLPFLRERLKRVEAPDRERVQRLIAELDSKKFNDRQKAAAELERLGDAAAHLLEEALPKASSVETRQRLEKLLNRVHEASSEAVRTIRAVEALEWTRAPEAVRLLEDLAEGAPAALLTREAVKARDRLRQRR